MAATPFTISFSTPFIITLCSLPLFLLYGRYCETVAEIDFPVRIRFLEKVMQVAGKLNFLPFQVY